MEIAWLQPAAAAGDQHVPSCRLRPAGGISCAIAVATHTPARNVRRRITGWDVATLVAANAVVVVGLWWRQGGIREVHNIAALLTSLGRVTGLLGALYLALVELLLLARVPVLDAVGDRAHGGVAPAQR